MKKNKVWFVTGASRGLGLEIVRTLLAEGYQVIATARNPKHVTEALGSPENLLAVKLDVTSAADAKDAVAKAIEKFGRIDVLVNNAGYGQLGWFEANSDEKIRNQIETNLFGSMNVTRQVLPVMRKQQSGHIFSVSSISGIQGFAGSSVYSASKFAVEGWMEALAGEIKPFGIQTTIIEPGFFRTDFLDSSSISHGDLEVEGYEKATEDFNSYISNMNHKQLGDPTKMGLALIELSESNAAPVRFAAGSDAYQVVTGKIATLTADSSEWKHLSVSTDGKQD